MSEASSLAQLQLAQRLVVPLSVRASSCSAGSAVYFPLGARIPTSTSLPLRIHSPLKSQVLLRGFKSRKICVYIAEWMFRMLNSSSFRRLSVNFFLIPERAHSSETLKPSALPQWPLHPGFESLLQFSSLPAGGKSPSPKLNLQKFQASFPCDKRVWFGSLQPQSKKWIQIHSRDVTHEEIRAEMEPFWWQWRYFQLFLVVNNAREAISRLHVVSLQLHHKPALFILGCRGVPT